MTAAPPFAVLNLDHVVVRTTDMEQALAFYCGALGLREERRVESIGLIQLRAGASMVDLVPAASEPSADGGNMDHLCLRIAPWDPGAIKSSLEAAGARPSDPAKRVGAEGNGWSIYVDDPDGNTVELKGPPIGD